MSCNCEKCGYKCDCGDRFCERCFVDTLDEVGKNLYTRGRFYDKKEDKDGNLYRKLPNVP